MASLTIKNIPDELYDQLKRSASVHHRSINSELIYCIEHTLLPARLPAAELVKSARLLRHRAAAQLIDPDEITDAKTQGRE